MCGAVQHRSSSWLSVLPATSTTKACSVAKSTGRSITGSASFRMSSAKPPPSLIGCKVLPWLCKTHAGSCTVINT